MDEILRALHYKLFSLLFLRPVSSLLNKIHSLIEDLMQLSLKEDFLSLLSNGLNRNDLRKLQVEHTRLFVNAFPSVPCPPYESYFLHRRLSHPDVVSGVRNFYSRVGYDVVGIASDHISAELEFMYVLFLKEDLDEGARFELLYDFFREHLSRWGVDFANCVSHNARIEFYRLAGDILGEFLMGERDRFGF